MGSSEKPGIDRFYTGLLVQIIRDTAKHLGLRSSSIDRDIASLEKRVRSEGLNYLCVVLPQLGKALDGALSADTSLIIPPYFKGKKYGSTILPEFLFELWKLVFRTDGKIKEDDLDGVDKRSNLDYLEKGSSEIQIKAVRAIRQICFLAYKLERPYRPSQQEAVIEKFISTDSLLHDVGDDVSLSPQARRALENASVLVAMVTKGLNPLDIVPRHGPGALATGEKPWDKYNFTHYFSKLDQVYSYADFFYFNYSHLHDELENLEAMEQHEATAKVVLVPKDSRGPRLISMEPLEIQWIQQGLARAMIHEIESPRSVTSGHVNFTCQEINRNLALASSLSSEFVTLDMSDASDRVSRWLVKKVFPDRLYVYLDACRSEYTLLPCGHVLRLKKFAPMGSACCFPVEALLFWALAVGSLVDIRSSRDLHDLPDVYVYGDDIICRKTDYEKFGLVFEELQLKFSEDKCCIGRFFRESCGCDAFKGKDVTPVRLHTLWSNNLSPSALMSYISYANALQGGDREYVNASMYLQRCIQEQFGPLPLMMEDGDYPFAFIEKSGNQENVRASLTHFRKRYNKHLHRYEYRLPYAYPHIKHCAPRSGWEFMWKLNQMSDDPFGFGQHMDSGDFTIPHIVKLRWTWVAVDRLSITVG